MVVEMDILNDCIWTEFSVYEIFETVEVAKKLQIPTGAMVEKKDLIEGETPRITVTGINNGVYGYFECKTKDNPNYRVYNNFISVSFLGTVFYQSGAASLDMKVHCLKPQNVALTENKGAFLVAIIKKSIQNSSYSDQLSSTILPYLKLRLPANGDKDILWDEIELYMEAHRTSVNNSICEMNHINMLTPRKIDTRLWKKFPIEQLFDVVKGSRLTKADMKEGNIRYIGASSFENGITQYISNSEHIHKANTLTVCYNGSDIGRTFYQSEPFWATDDVNVLYPKFNMTENIALFIAPIIKAVGGTHEYDDKWKKEDMEKENIFLPCTIPGVPDFEYIEKYIDNLKNEINNNLTTLEVVQSI